MRSCERSDAPRASTTPRRTAKKIAALVNLTRPPMTTLPYRRDIRPSRRRPGQPITRDYSALRSEFAFNRIAFAHQHDRRLAVFRFFGGHLGVGGYDDDVADDGAPRGGAVEHEFARAALGRQGVGCKPLAI